MRYLFLILTFISFSFADIIRIWAGGSMPMGSSKEAYHLWAFGKYPAPIIPNIRLEHTSFSKVVKDTNTSKDMTRNDVIFYYNLLDNLFYTTIDIGVGASLNEFSTDKAQPIGFARLRFEIPMIGIGIESSIKDGLSKDKFENIVLKVDYNIVGLFIDMAIEGGYRKHSIVIEDEKVNIDSDSYFLGVALKF